MNINFELILTLAVIVTGLIWLIDALFFAKQRQLAGITQLPILVEYSRSFFPVLLLVLLLRTFIAEPFRIPSGSDKPTLLPGDFIVVNKFHYGLRLPVLHTKILQLGEPKIGDIAIFRYPVDPSVDFIKRIIGVPGDRISYINKVLSVNGQLITQTQLGTATDEDESGQNSWPVNIYEEDLMGVQHQIYNRPDANSQDFSLVVPPGEYFAMGDNRDNSNDSRYWGFVPEQNLVGRAMIIWFSWDNDQHKVRWSRIGSSIK